MGCDIHGWIEKKVDNKWVAVSELKDRNRNYGLFADLAGVRGDGPDAKGLPSDVSETVKYWVDKWGPDAHDHSWLPLDEAYRIFRKHGGNGYYLWDMCGLDIYPYCPTCKQPTPHGDIYRLVFWFDN